MKINKQPSITQRLILLYTLTTLILFSIFSGGIYWIMEDSLVAAAKQYLIDEVHIIKGLLEKHPGDFSVLTQEVNGVPAELTNASYHYFVRIYQLPNTLKLETPNMSDALKQANYPNPAAGKMISAVTKITADNKKYVLLTALISENNNSQPTIKMQMAFDMSFQARLAHSVLQKIILLVLFITIVAILIGYFIAKNGLSSLHEITDLTSHITPSNLSKRLQVEKWPSELKPLVLSINNMLATIENSFNRLSECTAELAHELRTPIMNLMIQTETCLSKHRNVEEYNEVLTSNLEEFQRLSSLINNLLFLARSDDPRLVINKKLLNVKDELTRICHFYSLLASEKQITIDLVSTDILCYFDVVLFERAIGKLLENAIKFTEANGLIKIRANMINNEKFVISIIDNGIGIDVHELPHVFNKFYRGKNSHANSNFSTGFGLAIVKTIVSLHAGEVTIESLLHKGTKVDLTLEAAVI